MTRINGNYEADGKERTGEEGPGLARQQAPSRGSEGNASSTTSSHIVAEGGEGENGGDPTHFSSSVEHEGNDHSAGQQLSQKEKDKQEKERIRRILTKGTHAEVAELRRSLLPRGTIDDYAELFEDVKKAAYSNTDEVEEDDDQRHGVSYGTRVQMQNGIVTWTSKEKDIFYQMLSRKGRHRVREIANAIGSKTELEVADYLQLLERGLRWQQLRGQEPVQGAVLLGDIEAAVEISEKCCESLEDYAAVLRFRESYEEDVPGKRKHMDKWIVTGANAERIEEAAMKSESPTDPIRGSITYPPAILFKLSEWVFFSERFFMNATGARDADNWTRISHDDESPALTAEAFADFYALAVSITRRLVQSVLFMAMSRIQNSTMANPSRQVRVRDVAAALDVHNMPHGHFDFWPGLARRCSLDVADFVGDYKYNARLLDYEEVERVLSQEPETVWKDFTTSDQQRSTLRLLDHEAVKKALSEESEEEPEQEDEEEDEEYDDEDDEDYEDYVDDIQGAPADEHEEVGDSSSPNSSPSTDSDFSTSSPENMIPEEWKELKKDWEQFRPEYNHASRIDRDNSRAEERHLWVLMGGNSDENQGRKRKRKRRSSKVEAEHDWDEDEGDSNMTVTKIRRERALALKHKCKTAQDLVDWRDSIPLYQSEWETYGHDTGDVDREIKENHGRKRRRVDRLSSEDDFGGGGGGSEEVEEGVSDMDVAMAD